MEIACHNSNLEIKGKDKTELVAYEFYCLDESGKSHLLGILPERRKNHDRITNESIMNWIKKITGSVEIENNIIINQVKID